MTIFNHIALLYTHNIMPVFGPQIQSGRKVPKLGKMNVKTNILFFDNQRSLKWHRFRNTITVPESPTPKP
jgi:hypothetical protein